MPKPLRVLRPRLLFLENVSAIKRRGLGRVLGDLAELGYDARWMCLRASDIGAAHQRERWFCVAHPANPDSKHVHGAATVGPPTGGPRHVAPPGWYGTCSPPRWRPMARKGAQNRGPVGADTTSRAP
ncbi:DNA cytosine methyltransferase [Yinghuangia aomiensis]